MDELSFTLSSPITEEEWDMIADVDFEHTESILFHTKHGKEVEFVKRKKGEWIEEPNCMYRCSNCGHHYPSIRGYMTDKFCPNCGSYNGGGNG